MADDTDIEIQFVKAIDGIPYKFGWPLSRIRAQTKLIRKYWLDDIYEYAIVADQVVDRTEQYDLSTGKITQGEILDQYMWEEWTSKLEESRQFVFESLLEFGLCEGEAHFLSIKMAVSTISKFRLKMFIEFGGANNKAEFQKTALRNAINYLDGRFQMIKVSDKYLWSKEAVDDIVADFCKAAAFETANILVEETGAILHAKLML